MKSSSHIKRIAHITIGVSDLKNSVSFFQDVLGLEKMGEWSAYAIFDIAGVSFGLEPKSKTEICLLVDDVEKAYQNLKDKGVKFVTEPKDQPWGCRDVNSSALTETPSSSSRSNVKSVAKFVKAIASFLKNT